MATTTISASTCSRVAVRRRSSPMCAAFKASRCGDSTAHRPIPTESRSLRRPDLCYVALAPCVQSVIERRLELDLQVVVLAMDYREPEGDCLQSSRLRRLVDVGVDVGAMHDLGQAVQRRVVEVVLENDRLKAASPIHVAQLDSRYVVRDRALPLRGGEHFLSRYVEKLGIRVDEPFDQPRTRDPVDAGVLSGDPFHRLTPCRRNVFVRLSSGGWGSSSSPSSWPSW